MGSCKECYHYEVCRMHYQQKCELTYETEKEVRRAMLEAEKGSPICDHFKDRSLFVELPCRVNLCDEVYFVLRGLDEIDLKEYKFTVGNSAVSDTVQFITEIGTYGFWVGESPREFAPDYDDFYYWYELGETVFLSREEAEQALKLKERET